MNKTDIAKRVTSTVVGFCTSAMVRAIIFDHIDDDSTTQKVEATVASSVIGMMVADQTKKFTDSKIDEIVAELNEAKSKKS